MWDVVIVGGGPAGLSAALWLGRCQRSVLLCDADKARNARSRGVSGFLTRDRIPPAALREAAWGDIANYPSVSLREAEVRAARSVEGGFEIDLDGETLRARKLILAPGLMNKPPDIPDAAAFLGRGVYPCPYCDGWEHRGERLIAYGQGEVAREMAVELLAWSDDVVLLMDGSDELPPAHQDELVRRNIPIFRERIDRLEGDPEKDGLERVVLSGGRAIESRALFYAFDECRQSHLIESFGVEMSEKGAVETRACERTNVPGLFVPGDASRRVKFAIVAAAEGALAAFVANTELLHEDLARTS